MRIQSLSLSLCLALCAVPAFAGDEDAKSKQSGTHHQRLLEKFDANGDQRLDDHERAVARTTFSNRLKEKRPQLFAQLDTDGDQTLSKSELLAGRDLIRQFKKKHAGSPQQE